jgi:hypothetical protein
MKVSRGAAVTTLFMSIANKENIKYCLQSQSIAADHCVLDVQPMQMPSLSTAED